MATTGVSGPTICDLVRAVHAYLTRPEPVGVQADYVLCRGDK